MAKVLVAEKVNEKALEILKADKLEVDYRPTITREELLAIIGDYDGLIVRSVPIVDEELYRYATNLKVVGRAGNGIDNIDLEGATSRGILILNTPEANSVSACELTIGMIISSLRHIPRASASIKSGVWGRSRFQGNELRGKTLGIVGLGRIGSLVAQRITPFGTKVIAYDPYIADANFQRVGAEKKENLLDLVKEADIITVHTPKTAETLGMIGYEELRQAKKGVVVINCARGGIIDEAGLHKAMKEELVSAAACDVFAKEPCTESPLYEFDNFIATPHIGATTAEAQENVGVTIASEVAAALRGEMVPNAVNLPMIKHEALAELYHYLSLAELLGKFYHQLEKHAADKVEITYCGAAAKLESTDILTLAVLKGFFNPILQEQVNYVNARLVAQERGVAVVEAKEESLQHYLSLIRVDVYAGGKKYQYAGTLFGIHEPRIVELNGYYFDFAPARNMLIVENADSPGMIGRIGTLLGENHINIATMAVSRNEKKGNAMMVLTVDSLVGPDELDKIIKEPGIKRAIFLQL